MRHQATSSRARSRYLTVAILLLVSIATPLVRPSETNAATIAQTTAYDIPGFDPDQWDGQFNNPLSVAVDSTGAVYVADYYNNRIQKFDANGNFALKWGRYGANAVNNFSNPRTIAVDASDNLYVGQNNRIDKYDSTGHRLASWDQTDTVTDIAVAPDGTLYVTLGGNTTDHVSKLSPDGTLLTSWGSSGSGNGQFSFWVGNGEGDVVVDASGNVYVSDCGNSRIQKFSSSGTFLATWGTPGSADGQMSYPTDIAIDASGDLLVADQYNSRIQKFDNSGTFLTKWGSYGSGDGEFYYASAVAVAPNGTVFTADSNSNRIQRFTSAGVYETKWGSYAQVKQNYGPRQMVTGPDGNLWIALQNTSSVARMDPSDGSASVFALPSGTSTDYLDWIVSAYGYVWTRGGTTGRYHRIAADGTIDTFTWSEASYNNLDRRPIVDGNGSLWAAVPGHVAEIHEDGTYTDYASPEISNLNSGGTIGPDGNIWYASTTSGAYRLVRFDVNSHSFTSFDLPSYDSTSWDWNADSPLVADGQGGLWFTEYYSGKVASFDVNSESFAEFNAPIPSGDSSAYPQGLIDGPDGNLYYCASDRLVRMAPNTGTSTLTDNDCPGTYRGSATVSGELWLANGSSLTVIHADGSVEKLAVVIGGDSDITKLYAGPDGHVWFTSSDGKVYRVEGSSNVSVDYSVDKRLVTTGEIKAGDTVEYEFTVTNNSEAAIGDAGYAVYDLVPSWLDFKSGVFENLEDGECASLKANEHASTEEIQQFLGAVTPNHATEFSDLSYCGGVLPQEPGQSMTFRMRFEATAAPVPGHDNWAYLLTGFDDGTGEDDYSGHESPFFEDSAAPEGFDILDEWLNGSWQGYNNLARAVYDPTSPNQTTGSGSSLAASGQTAVPALTGAAVLLGLAVNFVVTRRRKLDHRLGSLLK